VSFFLYIPKKANKTEVLQKLEQLDSSSSDRLLLFVQTLIKINEREKIVRYKNDLNTSFKNGRYYNIKA